MPRGAEEVFYLHNRADQRSLLPPATVERPLHVYVGGDSLSGGPAFGFEELLADDPAYRVTEDVRLSTGVVTEWFFDWPAHLREEVARGPYDVIVLSMGGNDAQRFRGTTDAVGSEPWRATYRERIELMLRAVDSPGRLVVWVNMPPTSLPRLAGLSDIVNPLAVEATATGHRFVNVDAASIVAPDGVFTRDIEGPDGPLRVRAGDGVHYTRVGGTVLAKEVLAVIGKFTG